jgi:hypothetical protein
VGRQLNSRQVAEQNKRREDYNRAHGLPLNTPSKKKGTFNFLDPILDAGLAFLSPPLFVAYKAADAWAQQQRADAARERDALAQTRVEEPTPLTPEPDRIPTADPIPTFDLPPPTPAERIPFQGDQLQLGGAPMSILYQIGQALGQQTPAVRAAAAKLSGRKGGKRSARKRRAKKKAAAPRARKRKTSKRAKFVKGSAAAKAWGRKMKALRKKK